jgi:RNA polymerase sigma factor (sigma-70 family)
VGQTFNIAVAEEKKQNIIQAVGDYGKRLFYFIRGRVDSDEDAEDILQDVWYQFSNMMNRGPIEQTSAWLYRVARNRIIDKYRKKQESSLDVEFESELMNDEASFRQLLISSDSTAESKNLRDLFWEKLFIALEELPAEQRQVFVWHELEEVSFGELAEKTGENISTLISRKRYAVLHLRKRLAELYKQIIEH